jgi:hypothetical protein
MFDELLWKEGGAGSSIREILPVLKSDIYQPCTGHREWRWC